MVYLSIFILLVVLSFRYDINGKTAGRDSWYNFLLFIFILVVGLRWRIGIDTVGYLTHFYHDYPPLEYFRFEDYPIGKDPLFVLLNSMVITFGGRFYVVQLVQASIVNVLIFSYIKKHSKYVFTSLIFYAIISFASYNFEIMRGSISIAICLYGNDYFLEKKWFKGYLLYFIALLFHAQTIVLFVVPIFLSLRLNKKGILILLFAFLLGQMLNSIMVSFLIQYFDNGIIADKAIAYAESDFGFGEGLKLNQYMGVALRFAYCSCALLFLKRKQKDNPILIMEPFMVVWLLFLMVQCGFRLTYRYVEYFNVYIFFLFAELFVNMIGNKLSKGIAYLRSVIVFMPFFLASSYGLTKSEIYYKYYPYSSVISRTINKERESIYQHDIYNREPANKEEY